MKLKKAQLKYLTSLQPRDYCWTRFYLNRFATFSVWSRRRPPRKPFQTAEHVLNLQCHLYCHAPVRKVSFPLWFCYPVNVPIVEYSFGYIAHDWFDWAVWTEFDSRIEKSMHLSLLLAWKCQVRTKAKLYCNWCQTHWSVKKLNLHSNILFDERDLCPCEQKCRVFAW